MLERLAPLIPPPRAHQVRYYGILAPCASGRDTVVPGASQAAAAASVAKKGNREAACALDPARTCRPPEAETVPTLSIAALEGTPSAGTEGHVSTSQGTQAAQTPGLAQQAGSRPVPSIRPRRLPWADLLKRVFGVEALQCKCGKSMRAIAAITEPTVAKRILECMGLPPRAPPLKPARVVGFASDPWLDEAEAGGFDPSPPDNGTPGA